MRRPGILVIVLVVAVLVPSGPVASAAPARPTCEGVPATIWEKPGHRSSLEKPLTGTDGDDVIVGSDREDWIDAGAGDDLVCGMDGHDTFWDGPGHDRVYGGEGEDGLWQVTAESDFFDGGPNFDAVVYPFEGTEDLYVDLRSGKPDSGRPDEHDQLVSVGSVDAGAGDDVLIAGTETNDDCDSFPACQDYYLIGNDGDDVLIGGPRGEMILAGPGADVVRARGGRDYVDGMDDYGTPGKGTTTADRIDGGPGADVVDCDSLDVVRRASVRLLDDRPV